MIPQHPPEHISRDERIEALLRREVIEARVAPAASAGVARWTGSGWRRQGGAAGTRSWQRRQVVNLGTPFDLASITKSLFAFAFARSYEQGRVDFSTRLSQLLPSTAGTVAGQQSCEALLSHRGALRAHSELFAALRDGLPFSREQAIQRAANAAREPEADPSTPLYSDLGYILLGEALTLVMQMPLDEWLRQQLTQVGIVGIGSARQHASLEQSAAATETVPYRGGEIVGAVHDDNAWALGSHGCCGHAGLFGDVGSLLRFGTLLLDIYHGRAPLALRRETLMRLTRPRPGGSLRAGFDGKSNAASCVGRLLGGATFGHLGFTGTSFWCDPEAQIVVCLFTNRVCPTRDNPRIRAVRPRIHDALVRVAAGEPRTR